MGILDSLFGNKPARAQAPRSPAPQTTDEQAIARYRYLLRTAPPEAVEQAHTEAFAQLTPEQRAAVLRQLSAELPASERGGLQQQPDPQALARMATRAELRQPGIMERVLGPRGVGSGAAAMGGVGLGGMMAGTLLSSIAGTFIGSAIAHQFLGGFDQSPEAGAADAGQDPVDQLADSGDTAAQDESGAQSPAGEEDYGADDFGGDLGGDDFDV
jgi:hypothetical protein